MASGSTPFDSFIQWPYLSLGSLGRDKNLEGLDVVCDAPEGVSVSVGYDQRSQANRTTPYLVDGDTLTGTLIPIPLKAPSFDFKLQFEQSQAWEWFATNVYTVR